MLTKVQTVLRSAVTWLTALSVAAAQVADQITGLEPVVAQIVASLGAVVLIVRSVKPVDKTERGL